MSNELIKKLFWIPLFVVGIVLIILGPRWMIVEEPWLLSKVANEETLGMSFDKLFAANVNKNLPDYLRNIYRFFGLWVIGLGLMICSYVLMVDIQASKSRYTILAISGLILGVSLYLGHTFIPSSPFIYLMWGLAAIYLVSFFASLRLNKFSEM